MTKTALTSRILACVLWAPGLAAAVPHAVIPLTTQPPVIDGVFSLAEWGNAAVLRQILPAGSTAVEPAATSFYLQYDADHLYVAAVCNEADLKYPEAYERPWHDLFFRNDDAVQIVLGVADPEIAERGKVNVGGYQGALDNDFTAADFYYLFTVNAVNARQRQFNEAPLEAANFDSAVKVTPGERWVAEMRIPFAQCGLSAPTGQRIYANCFRFRPPAMYGWHLPGFGGYSPMPLGEFTFGAASEPPTVEASPRIWYPPPRESVVPGRVIPGPYDICTATLQYGPLNGAIVGEVTLNGFFPELIGVLEVDGLEPVEQRLEFTTGLDRDRNPLPERHAVVIRDFTPGSQPARQAKFTVRDFSGKVMAQAVLDCPAVTAPEWLGTDAGREYVAEKIPKPWTQPQIDASTVRLLDKEFEFAPNALPLAVRRDGARHALFSAAPRIRVRTAGREAVFAGAAPTLTADGTQVRIAGTLTSDSDLTLAGRARLDFDGFLEYKFELAGHDLTTVEAVEVELPLAPGLAKYLLPEPSVQQAGALTGAGYRGMAAPTWVGNEEEGLSFNYDIDPFRSRDTRHQIELRQSAAGDTLVLRLVDAPGQLKGTGAVFRFFLQPTPTKPYPQRPVRDWVTWDWEGWSRWHGYPDLSKTEALRQRVEELKKSDTILTLYCCQGLQEDAPEMAAFRADLELQPAWRYYVWQGKNCFATCKRGPEGDLQLYNYEKIIRDTGIRGLMSDGLSVPWGDSNPLHRNGCGRPEPVTLNDDTASLIVKQREFLKRMRGLFDATGEDFCLVAHTGGGIDVNTLSFFDAYFEGEQLMRYRRGYYPSEAMYATAYSGMPWGWRTIYWPKQLHNYDGLDTALAYALLFNSEYYTNANTEPDNIDVELLNRFSGPGSEFHPFWRPHTRFGFDSATCQASLYYNADESMLVISNLRYTPGSYRADLTALYPDAELVVTDLLLDRPVAGPVVTDELAPFSCRILAVRPQTAAVPPPPVAPQSHTGETQQWTVRNSAAVAADADAAAAGELVLRATPGQPEAQAEFTGFLFGRDATLRFSFTARQRLAVQLGALRFIHDNGWLFYTAGAEDATGVTDRYAPLEPGRDYEMSFELRDGRLTVWLDDRLLVDRKAVELAATGNRLTLGTWHDDTLQVRVHELTNQAPSVERRAAEFTTTHFDAAEWRFSNAVAGEIVAGELLLQAAPERGAATAEFTRRFGDDLYVEMMVRLPSRFTFQLGTAQLTYGGGWPGWGWMVTGPADPYGRGWIFQQVPLDGDALKPLVIQLHDGVLNVTYDGKVAVKNLALELPPAGNVFAIRTWHDDRITATLRELSTQPRELPVNAVSHPIQ